MATGYLGPIIKNPSAQKVFSTKSKEYNYTDQETKQRLAKLEDAIRKSKIWAKETFSDIMYIGYCLGYLENADFLSVEQIQKLNKIWKKYKKWERQF